MVKVKYFFRGRIFIFIQENRKYQKIIQCYTAIFSCKLSKSGFFLILILALFLRVDLCFRGQTPSITPGHFSPITLGLEIFHRSSNESVFVFWFHFNINFIINFYCQLSSSRPTHFDFVQD